MRRLLPVFCVLAFTGCVAFNRVDVGLGGKRAKYEEKVVREEPGAAGKIALLEVDGLISGEQHDYILSSKESMVAAFVEKLKLAEDDPDVKAVLIRLNTPGGEVTASDIIHNEIQRFKERRKIPVVASFVGISTSGGYYIASACDRIVAHPTCITGSIGVIVLHLSLEGLMEKVGVKADAIKSGAHKDMGSPFRDMTPENREILQSLVNQMFDRFVAVVVEGRKGKMNEDQVRKLADGRVFTAAEALKTGLVDRLGYLSDAIDETRKLAGLDAADLVAYSRRPDRVENPYSPSATGESLSPNAWEDLQSLLGMRLYYLWEAWVGGR